MFNKMQMLEDMMSKAGLTEKTKQEARAELQRWGVNLNDNNSIVSAIQSKTGIVGKLLPIAGKVIQNTKYAKKVEEITGVSAEMLLSTYTGITQNGDKQSAQKSCASNIFEKYSYLKK